MKGWKLQAHEQEVTQVYYFRILDFSNNNLQEDGVVLLLKIFPVLVNLDVSWNQELTDQSFRDMAASYRFPLLEELGILETEELFHVILPLFTTFPALKVLNWDKPIYDKDLKVIAEKVGNREYRSVG